jgi:hypothetical protein
MRVETTGDIDLTPYHRMVLTPSCFAFIGQNGAWLRGNPANPDSNVTPQDRMDEARHTAQALMGMTEEHRHDAMVQLKRANEVLHALVKAEMGKIRFYAADLGVPYQP